MFQTTNKVDGLPRSLSTGQSLAQFAIHFAIGLLFLSCAFSARAQSPEWVATSAFSYENYLPNTILQSGDTLWIEIRLGAAGTPANDVLGVDLWLSISENAVLPDSFSLDLSSSWLYDSTNVLTSTSVHADPRKLSFSVVRADSTPHSDQGRIIRIPVVAAVNNVTAASLITDGGGLVLVDNVDNLKMFPSSNLPVPMLVIRMEENGGLRRQTIADPEHLKQLPPGLYVIVESDAKGDRRVRKIWKR